MERLRRPGQPGAAAATGVSDRAQGLRAAGSAAGSLRRGRGGLAGSGGSEPTASARTPAILRSSSRAASRRAASSARARRKAVARCSSSASPRLAPATASLAGARARQRPAPAASARRRRPRLGRARRRRSVSCVDPLGLGVGCLAGLVGRLLDGLGLARGRAPRSCSPPGSPRSGSVRRSPRPGRAAQRSSRLISSSSRRIASEPRRSAYPSRSSLERARGDRRARRGRRRPVAVIAAPGERERRGRYRLPRRTRPLRIRAISLCATLRSLRALRDWAVDAAPRRAASARGAKSLTAELWLRGRRCAAGRSLDSSLGASSRREPLAAVLGRGPRDPAREPLELGERPRRGAPRGPRSPPRCRACAGSPPRRSARALAPTPAAPRPLRRPPRGRRRRSASPRSARRRRRPRRGPPRLESLGATLRA